MGKIAQFWLLLFLAWPIALVQAEGYGYGTGAEDPLIKAFQNVVKDGKTGNWPKVSQHVKGIEVPLKNLKEYFKIDLQTKLEAGIRSQDIQVVVKSMAHLIFLAIKEKFYWNLKENLSDPAASLSRLKLAKRYYTDILMGNVKNLDGRHQSNLNESILAEFENSFKALGNPGVFGMGAIPPKPDEFKESTLRIEGKILKAFPYFD